MAKFEINLRKRNNPKEDLIEDLRRVSREMNGAPVTGAIYDERGKFGKTTVLRRFGSWNTALREAGLPINNIVNIPDEELHENLATLWQKLGRQPVGSDVNKATGFSKYSLGTYEKRFGTWNKALQTFGDFINRADEENNAATKQTEESVSTGNRVRSAKKINWRLRATVLIRDNCICRMCGASPSKDPAVTLHVDHIEPWSRGGETVSGNLQTLCLVCNIGKSDQILEPKSA